MKLFGGLLPFIGYRDIEVDDEMRQFFDLPDEQETMATFQVEWFEHGIVLVLGSPCLKADE